MGETSPTLAGVLSRAAHIASVVILVGGIFYARFFSSGLAEKFRNWIYAAILLLVGSGLYNLLTKASYPPGYHAWFGVKMLLVLHIFAASLVASLRADGEGRRSRTLTGILVSAAAVILISAWLRWISLG
jgi:hypothetical protein